MNEIPEVVEQLYYNWVVIPGRDGWSGCIGADPLTAQGLCAFCQGLCPGMGLAEVRKNREPYPIQDFLR